MHIDKAKLLACLKQEAEFCKKEKFNEKNNRFYLGREMVLTDMIRQIESGKFDAATDSPLDATSASCEVCDGEGGITIENFGDPESFECPDCKGTGRQVEI